MRWIKKLPINGEIRRIKRFLFLPTKIGSEIRWLEFAIIKQKYIIPTGLSYIGPWWHNMEWVDE